MGRKWSKLKNLFGSDKYFFDKEATINEYFSIVPESERPNVDDYEELYQIALSVVGKQDFIENTKELDSYFHELTQDEMLIAIMVGSLAYALVREIDKNGTKIEQAIDKVLPKNYDKHNPFDTKRGYGHRIFGHDPVVFGIKRIPKDTLIHVKDVANGFEGPVRIGEYLGVGLDGNVSMWDLIMKFYGEGKSPINGLMNAIGHIIVHFGKDLLTPAGLPIPLTSLLDGFDYNENMQVHVIRYKDSWAQKLANEHLSMKASDFASLVFIESILAFYCSKKDYGSKNKGFRQDMKLIAIGTCLSMQMATSIVGTELQVGKKGNKSIVIGGNANLILTGAYLKILVQECYSIVDARKVINRRYDEE